MPDFVTENLGTVIVGAILTLIVFSVLAMMIRNKKKGKSSCSCGCSECPFSGKCSEVKNVVAENVADDDVK